MSLEGGGEETGYGGLTVRTGGFIDTADLHRRRTRFHV